MASSDEQPLKTGVLDELICFLGDPMFQIPVRSFMDENCIIFDSSTEPTDDHRRLFSTYFEMVTTLLDGFCRDVRMSYADAERGICHISSDPDLREVFYGMAEPVLAATDFSLFLRVMVRHNVLIQEQVLRMILASTGVLPDSFTDSIKMATAGGTGHSAPASRGSEATAVKVEKGQDERSSIRVGDTLVMRYEKDERDEDEILREVFKKSKEEPRVSNSWTDSNKLNDSGRQDAVQRLKLERNKMEEDMKRLVIESKPVARLQPETSDGKLEPKSRGKTQAATDASPLAKSSVKKNVTPAEAADDWLKSAQSEISTSTTNDFKTKNEQVKVDPAELEQRQEFLRLQRTKLLAIKKESREKQLGEAEKSRPQRIQSATAARRALHQGAVLVTSQANDEAAKLASRRAVAEKLRAEVVDQ